jgi:hypothetical protein
VLLVVLAQTGSGSGNSIGDFTSLAQYGVVGLLVVALLFGQAVPGYIAKQKDARIAALEAENAAMRAKMEDDVIPALVRTTDLLARLTEDRVTERRRRGTSP